MIKKVLTAVSVLIMLGVIVLHFSQIPARKVPPAAKESSAKTVDLRKLASRFSGRSFSHENPATEKKEDRSLRKRQEERFASRQEFMNYSQRTMQKLRKIAHSKNRYLPPVESVLEEFAGMTALHPQYRLEANAFYYFCSRSLDLPERLRILCGERL